MLPPLGSVTLDRLEIYYSYFDVSVNFYFSNLMENPFLNYGEYYYEFDSVSDIPCFLNEFVFKNANTNETFQAEYPGRCRAFRNDFVSEIVSVTLNARDYLRMVSDEFVNTTSTTPIRIEVYTADTLGYPFNLRIEPNDTIESFVDLQTYSYLGANNIDYWVDEGIIMIHFNALIDVDTVDISMISLSSFYRDEHGNNTVNITGAVVLNEGPGLTQSVGIRITSSDRALLASKGICVLVDIYIQDCFISFEEGFAVSHFGEEVGQMNGFSVVSFMTTPGELRTYVCCIIIIFGLISRST